MTRFRILKKRRSRDPATRPDIRPYLVGILLIGFVVWAHLGSGLMVFGSKAEAEPGWAAFASDYGVDEFGSDGYFVRAVRNGYNLFYHTHQYAWRFTRKTVGDSINACAGCHRPEDMAYGFVGSDRFDPLLDKRVSFEERVMRCFADRQRMDGFVPTIYDPAIRDLRIFARMIANHLQLSEGSRSRGA